VGKSGGSGSVKVLDDKVRIAHDAAVADGRAGYFDPDTGLFVMTVETLRDKGSCCEQGCRHCPWDC